MKQLIRTISCALLLGLVVIPVFATPQDRKKETDELISSAANFYRQKNYDAALLLALKAAALSPDDFRPHALVAGVYLAQRKLKSASESYAEAIRLQPQKRELYLAKAHVDMLRNARDEAAAAARKAIEVDPNFAEAHAMLGNLLQFDVTRREEAITALRTAIKLKPEIRESYEWLAEIFQQAKDVKGAEEVLRQGMAADPKRMAGRFQLGRMLVKQGRLDEARKLWDERTSDDENTFPKFIDVLTRAENLKRATETLAKKPDDPDALVEMGLAVMDGDHWVVDGRQKKALVYFQKALALKPGHARAQYGICKAYIQGVDFVKDETKIVDQELAKLRSLDPKLAEELDAYRKNYVKGIRGTPVKTDQ